MSALVIVFGLLTWKSILDTILGTEMKTPSLFSFCWRSEGVLILVIEVGWFSEMSLLQKIAFW